MPDNAFGYPLAVPTVSGTNISVDTMLNEPARITRYLNDITLQRFWFQRIFTPSGGVNGGSLIYDQLTANDLYPDRDVQNVEPGAEFPILTSSRPTPKTAQVEKFGGKVFVTDEARRRNDSAGLNIQLRKIANAMVRKTHQRAIAELDAVVAAIPALTVVGANWQTVMPVGTSPTDPALWPAADLAKLGMLAETDELGVSYDLLLLNPAQALRLSVIYGPQWREAFRAFGYEVETSNRITAGTAYAVEQGNVGGYYLEAAMATETWREHGTQRTWVQTDVSPLFAITNPYGVRKLTGLAG